MFETIGTLRYSPKLIGDQPASPNWWLILSTDPNIGNYFRHLYLLQHHRCKTLRRPAWDAHVTVIRNERPIDSYKHLWEKHSGLKVPIQVNPEAKSNGDYCWLPITSEFLLDVREELGLERHPYYPLHLSIGHQNLGQ